MFSTCIFCNHDLGRNEALEHFPIARRIAYDPTGGRLWAVCRKCERWNLSPLETRWEAIEDAERAFRGTPLRVATDNIALARLHEGLELVRVGTPPRLELAGWRYGDQFGKRWRRNLAIAGTVGAGTVAANVGQIAGSVAGLATLSIAGSAVVLAGNAYFIWRMRRDARRVRSVLHAEDGSALSLTNLNLRCAALLPADDLPGWGLRLPYLSGRNVAVHRPPSGRLAGVPGIAGEALLEGRDAQRALSMMLPYLNRGGASRRRVHDAVDVVGASATLDHLLGTAARNTEGRRIHFKAPRGESNIGILPPRLRLAMEMVMHEDDERRALEGELRELEARWREADAIAKIADELLLPTEVDARLEHIKRRDV